jgi:hypothetical protein
MAATCGWTFVGAAVTPIDAARDQDFEMPVGHDFLSDYFRRKVEE